MTHINAAHRCRGPAQKQKENDANTRIRHDDHHGRCRSGAWAAGGQVAARCAAVPGGAEHVAIHIMLLRTPAGVPAKYSRLHGRARSFFLYAAGPVTTPTTEESSMSPPPVGA